ncbi:MAG TPA: carboxypeptidase regulatory-like domain-containing protein [Gemmatimonadaceae bacterium]|nr:carboxypeptidase regulatory-like domain-containing protein [Gemmatimonadaceae bacterium]
MLKHARIFLLASVTLSVPAAAQPDTTAVLSMSVTSQDGGEALPYGTIAITPLGLTRFTDENGHLTFRHVPPGTYTLRAREIGFAPKDTTVILSAGQQQSVTIALNRVAIRLARVLVQQHRSGACIGTGLPEYSADADVNEIFHQLKANIDRVRLLTEQYPLEYSLDRVRLARKPGAIDRVIQHDTTIFDDRKSGYAPGQVLYYELDRGEKRRMVRLITFADLGDSSFLANHCFTFAGVPLVERTRMIQIDFQPAKRLKKPDVEGSIYLDANRFVVLRADVHLSHPEWADPPIDEFGVITTFKEVAPLITLIATVDSSQPSGSEREIEHDRLLKFTYVQRSPGQ